MDKSMDAGVDGRWMSYAELTKIRHIDKTSALRLALPPRVATPQRSPRCPDAVRAWFVAG